MKHKVIIFLAINFLLGFVSQVQAQNALHFAKITIKAATQRANIENKNIFVDTYAPWCGPCKIMDIHFQDKEVMSYFNQNFINVKIDTDTPYGKKISAKYQIAFLPTILILDKDGVTRYKVDKLINRDELLSLAKFAIEGPSKPRVSSTPVSPPVSPKKEIASTNSLPKVAKKKKENVAERISKESLQEKEKPEEKILYVLDGNATNLPPEILYEEAYFRMQLNDRSQKEAAKKYLATQEDWNSEKNLKFIFDFLYDTDSEEFKYFIQNKEKFQEFISQEKINRSLKILVEYKLYQGIPRPSFERSQYLLSLIDQENSEKNNYHYFLNRLHDEGKNEKFNSLCNDYFKKYKNPNQEIAINYVSLQLLTKNSKGKLKTYISLLDLIENQTQNYDLLLAYTKLYFTLSDKENTLIQANRAIEIGQQAKIDVSEAKQILENTK